MRRVMQGVGVFQCEGTDNMYYRGSTRIPEGSSVPQVMDVQGSQPPITQPTQ
ncbi:hypothetical protein LINGRAHAP2_LOCUS31478 [Linum grandiflorum]